MAVKTHFTASDFKAMLHEYHIGELVNYKPFDQGQDQTNILLTTTSNKVVLRYYEKRTLEYAAFEIELLHHLAARAYPSAAPYQRKDEKYVGLYNGKPFAVFNFLSGEHTEEHDTYLQAARAIGQLHSITAGYRPQADGRPTYDQEYVWACAKDSAKHIAKETDAQGRLAWLRAELSALELPNDLPKGTCHGDTNPGNFLYTNGRLSGVLDFDQASYTWLLFDVAELIYWWAWPDRGEIDFEKATSLLHAYNQERPMTDSEKAHLFDTLKFVLLVGVGWFLHDDEDYRNHVRKIEFLNEISRKGFSARMS